MERLRDLFVFLKLCEDFLLGEGRGLALGLETCGFADEVWILEDALLCTLVVLFLEKGFLWFSFYLGYLYLCINAIFYTCLNFCFTKNGFIAFFHANDCSLKTQFHHHSYIKLYLERYFQILIYSLRHIISILLDNESF